MTGQKIGIIGGGNLGRSIAMGLVKSKKVEPSNIIVSRRKVQLIEDLKSMAIQVSSDNNLVAEFSDVLILAVKPHQAVDVSCAA